MKKLFLAMMAIVALFATSCQKETSVSVGEEATVSFNISTPEIATRAYSDGKTATVLQYAVYDAQGNELKDLTVTNGKINISTTVNLQLTTGNTYSVIFWAAAEGAPYSVDFANKTMTVDYAADKTFSNDEGRDAFYAHHTFEVKGTQTETIKLYRPFAQLNIGTADYATSEKAGYNPTQSAVKVAVYNTLNFVDGTVSGENVVTFAAADIKKDEKFPVADDVYDYLAMNYLLVANEKATVDVEFSYADGTNVKTRTVGSVPVQRNYRTNIYGSLLTSEVDINVEIVPEYNEPDNDYTSTLEGKLRLAAAVGGTVTLTEDVALHETLVVQEGVAMVINLSSFNLINQSASTELGEGDGIIVYGDLTIEGDGLVQGNTRAVWARGNTGAKVTIKGGSYVGAVSGNCEVIYASGNGKIDIYGGTFSAEKMDEKSFAAPQYAVLNLHGNGKTGCDIKVYGGRFLNFNPADNISENPKYSFVAPTSFVVEQDGYFVVRPFDGAEGDIKLKEDFDGNGATVTPGALTVTNKVCPFFHPEGTVTIENVTIDGENKSENGYGIRGIYVDKAGVYTINNVEVRNVTYAINVNTKQDVTLNVSNSILEGWTSYGISTTATFVNVSFENGVYANFKPYGETTVKNCSFQEGFKLDFSALEEAIVFENCTYNGTVITADNIATLCTTEAYEAKKSLITIK